MATNDGIEDVPSNYTFSVTILADDALDNPSSSMHSESYLLKDHHGRDKSSTYIFFFQLLTYGPPLIGIIATVIMGTLILVFGFFWKENYKSPDVEKNFNRFKKKFYNRNKHNSNQSNWNVNQHNRTDEFSQFYEGNFLSQMTNLRDTPIHENNDFELPEETIDYLNSILARDVIDKLSRREKQLINSLIPNCFSEIQTKSYIQQRISHIIQTLPGSHLPVMPAILSSHHKLPYVSAYIANSSATDNTSDNNRVIPELKSFEKRYRSFIELGHYDQEDEGEDICSRISSELKLCRNLNQTKSNQRGTFLNKIKRTISKPKPPLPNACYIYKNKRKVSSIEKSKSFDSLKTESITQNIVDKNLDGNQMKKTQSLVTIDDINDFTSFSDLNFSPKENHNNSAECYKKYDTIDNLEFSQSSQEILEEHGLYGIQSELALSLSSSNKYRSSFLRRSSSSNEILMKRSVASLKKFFEERRKMDDLPSFHSEL
ncbi:hypothetical protein SNEBB_005623 [Seison nebaliae]|nr:hypothetical protein SNEBB_005623 [Seison nebaliae]